MRSLCVVLMVSVLAVGVFADVGPRYGIEAGAGVDGASLGDTITDALYVLGSADEVEEGTWETVYWLWSKGLAVTCDNDTRLVLRIMVFDPYDKATQEGLKIGDTRETLLMLYGKPERINAGVGQTTRFEYWSKGINILLNDDADRVSAFFINRPYSGPIAVEQASWAKVKASFR